MIERNLPDFKPMQERCSNCSYCKWIPLDKIRSNTYAAGCPASAYYHFNAYSARGRFQLGLAVVNGEDVTSPGYAEMIHSCMLCGSCDLSCKMCRYNLEPLQHNAALKADAIEKGITLPGIEKYRARYKESAGKVEVSRKKSAWADGLGLKDLSKEKAEILFFAGCKYAMSPELRENVRFAAKLLVDNGYDVGQLGEQQFCCGAKLYAMGCRSDFEEAAAANIELIRQTGVKKIVTPCADCFHAFKRLYAALGLQVEVLHITEVIDELLTDGKLQFTKPVEMTVTYHDPCHLGRQGEPYVAWDGHEKKIRNQIHTWEPRRPRYIGNDGVYDAPRRILAAIPGIRLVEMERIREYSWCCGAGGGCSLTLPDYAAATAQSRIHEAVDTGAQALVTACGNCNAMLSGAADGIEVLDLLSLVRQAL